MKMTCQEDAHIDCWFLRTGKESLNVTQTFLPMKGGWQVACCKLQVATEKSRCSKKLATIQIVFCCLLTKTFFFTAEDPNAKLKPT